MLKGVTLGLLIQLVIKMFVDLSGGSILDKETSKNS